MRLHVTAGDVLVMPANFLNFVLTKGNAISLGTNFLAFGHLPMIRHSIIVEFPRRSDDKFPDLAEMLVLLMYRIAEKLCPRICRRLVSMYSTVQSIYNEHAAREVRFLSLRSLFGNKTFPFFHFPFSIISILVPIEGHFLVRKLMFMNKSCFFQDFKTHIGHSLQSCLTDIHASKTQLSEILRFYVNKFIINKNFTLKISYFSIESLLSRLKV